MRIRTFGLSAPVVAAALPIVVAGMPVASAQSPSPVEQPSPAVVEPSPQPISTMVPGPSGLVTAQETLGPYRLRFTLPRTTWSTDDAIDGIAVFETLMDGTQDVGSSGGGLFSFGFSEVGGTRAIGPAMTSDCVRRLLQSGVPLSSAIVRSGGWGAEDPDAAFYRGFFTDPIVRLPAGTWDITAYVDFVEGGDCSGTPRALSATVRVEVTP